MSILQWLRANYGWKTKGRDVLIVIVAIMTAVAIWYYAEQGGFGITAP